MAVNDELIRGIEEVIGNREDGMWPKELETAQLRDIRDALKGVDSAEHAWVADTGNLYGVEDAVRFVKYCLALGMSAGAVRSSVVARMKTGCEFDVTYVVAVAAKETT